ncbi:MAG: hypothetical protein ACTSRP_23825 [Candidatus Helarchaeota archaeon]
MNIAIITTSKNSIMKLNIEMLKHLLEELKEEVFIFNNNSKPKIKYYNLGFQKKNFGKFKGRIRFFLFYLFIIYKILLKLKNYKIKERLILVIFYSINIKKLKNNLISLRNLIFYFNKLPIDILIVNNFNEYFLNNFLISALFKKPIVIIINSFKGYNKRMSKILPIISKDIENFIVDKKIIKEFIVKSYNIPADKISILENNKEIKQNILHFHKIIKNSYFEYYKYSTGGNFRIKIKNPF